MLMIDGIAYPAHVLALNRSADVLDKYANRTESGDMNREILGVYFNYELQLEELDPDEYNRLWDKLTEPEEFHELTVPDGAGGTVTFTGYISSVKDHLILIDQRGRNHWSGLSAKFTAKAPTRA